MAQKIIADGDADGLYDRLQYETALAEREQNEAVREAVIEYLDQTETHAEFCQAMVEKDEMVAEPGRSLDECSFRDYRIRRNAGEGR